MKRPMKVKCRLCGRAIPERCPGEKGYFPFCSARCRDTDLGNWFEDKYRVPVKDEEIEGDLGEEGFQ